METPEKGARIGGETAEERKALIRAQVEYWFSRDNLARDYFLVQHMDSNYFVNLEVLSRVRAGRGAGRRRPNGAVVRADAGARGAGQTRDRARARGVRRGGGREGVRGAWSARG